MDDKLNAREQAGAALIRGGGLSEQARAHGKFMVECVGADGKVKWRAEAPNVVTTVGKNYALDGYLQTAVTIVGPFMGLISSVGYGAGPVVGDTMGSHAGWTEAGITNAPTYTVPRKTCAWSAAAAGAKALSAALSFAITGTGTVKGAFIVLGSGAVNTVDSTAGILYSAGLFTPGGDRAVVNGDTLNVSYTTSL